MISDNKNWMYRSVVQPVNYDLVMIVLNERIKDVREQ